MGRLESVPEFLKSSRTKIHEYEEVKRMAGSIHPMVQSSPEDLFTLLYTSGTSGEPKGVMLTESNAACSIAGCLELIKLSQSDVHISYLPLAHSYEMVCMLSGLLVGASAGFWRGDINGLLDDIQALRPTILVGVPRVFDRIYGRIMCGLEEASRVKRALFSYAYDSKRRAEQMGGASSIWEGVIFKRFKDLLGKRVRMIVSGSAPLNPKVQEFLRVVTGATVIQGYGLTETFALVCVQRICDKKATGHVGPPIGTVEVKLVDVPELGYVSSVDQHRGEVCVRGTNVFVGYYKDEAKTSDVLEPDGWFHTGDVGEWLPNGTLRIIDRKKNIFKLSQGEYVAVDNLESVFSQARFVGQIYIHGDSMSDYLVAIVVPDAEALVGWAELAGMSKDVRRLCADTKVKILIYEELCKVAKENQLHGYQIPRQIYLEPDPWTVESGVLTPSLKTKRFVMRKMYEAVFKELYRLPRLDGSNGRAKL
ncbi:uncharacterized protein LOC126326519 isoform X2 [Schistocerca gregaria]|nr:uncharacterized protein LOC126326519 isoform X2 [Schistocerca gregaria]